jgi:GTP-binding protein
MADPTSPLPLQFVQSASDVAQLPPTRAEVAIVGRSNVGKSSLINAVANRNGLAKVSKTPGRTQLLNLFSLPDGTSVVDLPGYGFANAPAAVRARWPEMIDGYLLRRQHLRAIVVLIDAEVGPTRNDVETLGWLRSHGLPVRIVATKHDKVRPSRRGARRAELAAGCGVPEAEVLWVSAAKHVNVGELRRRLRDWLRVEIELPAGSPSPSPSSSSGPGPAAEGRGKGQAAKGKGAPPRREPQMVDGVWDDEDEW